MYILSFSYVSVQIFLKVKHYVMTLNTLWTLNSLPDE